MKKKGISLYYIILLMFLQVFAPSAMAITEMQSATIVEHCDTIKENLKKIQKADARTRVYLGGYYETILTKFITPLNVRLVENNLSSAEFVENQNKFAKSKVVFASDFVTYQQNLEELVGMNCKTEPERFYDKLSIVRQKRKTMTQDVSKMRNLISDYIRLVEEIKGRV